MTQIPPPHPLAPSKGDELALQEDPSKRTKVVEIHDVPPKFKLLSRKPNTVHYVGKLAHSAVPQIIPEEGEMIPQSVYKEVPAHKMTDVAYASNAIEEELNERITAEPPE